MKRILTGKQSPSGGRQGRKKEKVKRKKWEGGSRGSSPLPREAGSWELEGPAVTATRPTAKNHLQRRPCEEAAADAAIPKWVPPITLKNSNRFTPTLKGAGRNFHQERVKISAF